MRVTELLPNDGDFPAIARGPLTTLQVNQVPPPPERWMRVTVSPVNLRRQVELSVTDSGPGLPENEIEQLFDPLISHRDGGNGLGLAIARSIIEAHGGSIAASNEPGAGARFRILLPLSDGESSHEV